MLFEVLYLSHRKCISGVMRLTVTVVVIMFELTGALPYILPTMVSRTELPVGILMSNPC
jgi:hypothetical protein